jgi:ABC-type uncharacterized transport system substrate-binding protein
VRNGKWADVRYGSKADISECPTNVCFTPECGHQSDIAPCPLCAKAGHEHVDSPDQLDLLKQALPGLSRVAVLREAIGAGVTARAVMLAGQTPNLQVFILEVRAPNELDDAFSEMTRIGVGGLSVLESPLMTAESNRVAFLALQHRIPAIFPEPRFLEAGGLISYGPQFA